MSRLTLTGQNPIHVTLCSANWKMLSSGDDHVYFKLIKSFLSPPFRFPGSLGLPFALGKFLEPGDVRGEPLAVKKKKKRKLPQITVNGPNSSGKLLLLRVPLLIPKLQMVYPWQKGALESLRTRKVAGGDGKLSVSLTKCCWH